jgi:uncharacterized protein (TIGR00251 family)
MIAVTEVEEGCILAVRAQPGARKSGVLGEQAGALKLAVTAPAEDGRANKALVELLRELLDLKRSQVEFLRGQTSRRKQFLVKGLKKADLEKRLQLLFIGLRN